VERTNKRGPAYGPADPRIAFDHEAYLCLLVALVFDFDAAEGAEVGGQIKLIGARYTAGMSAEAQSEGAEMAEVNRECTEFARSWLIVQMASRLVANRRDVPLVQLRDVDRMQLDFTRGQTMDDELAAMVEFARPSFTSLVQGTTSLLAAIHVDQLSAFWRLALAIQQVAARDHQTVEGVCSTPIGRLEVYRLSGMTREQWRRRTAQSVAAIAGLSAETFLDSITIALGEADAADFSAMLASQTVELSPALAEMVAAVRAYSRKREREIFGPVPAR